MRNLKITTFTFLLCLAFLTSVRADEIHLTDGRIIKGQVRSEKDGVVTVERSYGMLKIDKKEIVKVVKTNDVFDRYDSLAAESQGDPSKLMQLALWCDKKGLNHRKRETARALLAKDKNHAGARKLLGQVKFGDKWVSKSTAFAKQGRVKRDGRWLSAEESNQLRQARKERVRLRKLQRRMNSYVRRIYSRNAKTSEKAYVKLIEFAKKEKIKGLRPIAASFYRDAVAQRAALSSVTTTVRMQQASLIGLRERSLSLANGTNVRIQLPETRHVGIGTTVGVPLR